jgi:hypothetical protein
MNCPECDRQFFKRDSCHHKHGKYYAWYYTNPTYTKTMIYLAKSSVEAHPIDILVSIDDLVKMSLEKIESLVLLK